eukprot:3341488-Amphidinium_carterae.1
MASHADQNNISSSDIIVIGQYLGGELSVDGYVLHCHRKWAVLAGSTAKQHAVAKTSGRRWSIVLHTPNGMKKMNKKTLGRLRDLGFPVRDEAGSLRHHGRESQEVEDRKLREYKACIALQGNNIRASDDVSASEVFKDVFNTLANMAV